MKHYLRTTVIIAFTALFVSSCSSIGGDRNLPRGGQSGTSAYEYSGSISGVESTSVDIDPDIDPDTDTNDDHSSGGSYSSKTTKPTHTGESTSTKVTSGTTKTTNTGSHSATSVEPGDYYSGISDSLEGDALLSALRSLNNSKQTSRVGYSSMGTSPSGDFRYTDYDPDTVKYDSNGQPYGTKLITFYSGNSASSGMNREHVWPKSHGGNLVEADIHMPRPTLTSENGSRGNSFYVEGKADPSGGWDPAEEDFGIEDYRGDSARIVFYCVVAQSKLDLYEADSHSTSNANPDYLMGRLSTLLKWNLNYNVKDREQRRNAGAEYLQGNRNPFIDHPEYACRIWGTKNATTRSICGM